MSQDWTNRKTFSVAGYARHRGVTPAAVRYAIKTGALKKAVVQRDPEKPLKIDVEIADQEWVTDVRTDGVFEVPNVANAEPTGNAQIDTVNARAKKEAYDAELARLKVEKEKAKLVEVDEVKAEAFKLARAVRDALLNIPDRVAGELAAETDEFKIHKRLTEEIRQACEELGGAE